MSPRRPKKAKTLEELLREKALDPDLTLAEAQLGVMRAILWTLAAGNEETSVRHMAEVLDASAKAREVSDQGEDAFVQLREFMVGPSEVRSGGA